MGRIIYRKGDLEAIRATFKVEQHFSREDEERFQLLEDKQVTPVKRESGGGGSNNNGGGTRGGGEPGSLSTSTHNNHSSNNSGTGGSGFHSNHLSSNVGGGGSFGNHNSGHHHNNNNNMNNGHNSRGGDGNHNRGDRRDHRRQLNDRFSLPQRPPRVGNRDEEAFEAGYRYELEMNEAQRRELQAAMEKEEKKHQQDRQRTETAPSSLPTEKEQKKKETEELEQFFASLTDQQALPAGGVVQPAKKSRFFQSGASASETKASETDVVKTDLIWGPSSSPVVDGDAAIGGGAAGGMRDSRESGVNASTNMSSSNTGVGRRADPNALPLNVFGVGDEKDSHFVAEVREGAMNLPSSFHQHVSAGMQTSASQDNRDAANKSFSSASANQLAQLLLSSISAGQRSQGPPHGSSSTDGVRGGSHYLPVATGGLSNGSAGGHDTDGNRSAPHPGQVWNVHDLERVLLQERSGNGASKQRGGGEGGEAPSGLLEGKAISASELESRLIQQARQKNSRNNGSSSGSPTPIALNSSTESGNGLGNGTPGGNLSPLTSAQSSNIPSPTIPAPPAGAPAKPHGVQVASGSSSASFQFPGLNVNQTIQVAQQQQQQQQSAGAPRYLQQAQTMQQWSALQYPQGVNLSKILVAPSGVAGQNGSKLPPGSGTSWNSSSPFVTYGYTASKGVNGVVYSNPQQQLMYQSRNISPFSTNANPNQYALFAQQQQQQQQASRPQQQPGKQ